MDPTNETTQGSVKTAIRIVREAVPKRWRLYALSLICMVGIAAFTGALAYSTKLIINDVFVAGSTIAAWQVALLVVFIAFGKSVFDYSNTVLSARFTRSVAAEYQKKIFRQVMHKSVVSFRNRHPARHMAKILLYGRASGGVVVSITNKMVTDGLTLVVLVGVMIAQDPMMSLIGLFLFPLIFFMISRLANRIRGLASTQAKMSGIVQGVGTEAIEGIKTVKSYGLEEKTIDRFTVAVDELEDRVLRITRATALTVPFMEFLGGIVLGGFVVYASWQTTSLGKTPGEFTAFISAFLLAYQPAERLSKVLVDVQKSLVHVSEMYSVMEANSDDEEEGQGSLPIGDGALKFENVSFNYTGATKALEDLSFSIKPGERAAIVGQSGAGKTTTIDLLQRFYSPTKGKIFVGETDIAEVTRTSLRQNIAYISQDVFLFEGTIRENIADGNEAATNAEIEQAATLAQINGFSASLPDGLDTNIGPNGASLSGGQKQRIGIARALVKRAKIYIYDEATSALDGETERAIMEAAVGNAPESIVLFVTHRPSTLEWVDQVIMLDKGKLLAIAPHQELATQSEKYRSLFNLTQEPEYLGKA